MKTYNQLIRLHEYRLHQRQKVLARLQSEEAEMQLKIDSLQAEMLIEEARALESPLGSATFGSYFRRASEKRRALADARNEIARNVVGARMELKKAFDELKRIETLRDQKLAEAREAERKAEQAALDEVALQQHRRGESA